jgi:DNA-binding GntR family transcriptional regulator
MNPRAQGERLEERSRAQQIADYYIRLIEMGTITEGEQLPGRTEIVQVWGVGVKTAQNALKSLRDRGWAVAVARQASYAAWPRGVTM